MFNLQLRMMGVLGFDSSDGAESVESHLVPCWARPGRVVEDGLDSGEENVGLGLWLNLVKRLFTLLDSG